MAGMEGKIPAESGLDGQNRKLAVSSSTLLLLLIFISFPIQTMGGIGGGGIK
jgi:hypothetical protein